MYALFKASLDKDLKPIDKSILILFFKMCGTKGYCWPSYNYIADKMNISRRYAIERVNYLLLKKYIIKSKRTIDGTEEQTSNRYFVNNNPE